MEDIAVKQYTFKDFQSDQEVRWCPGCDDYVILRSMLKALPEMEVKKEDVVFISGIGESMVLLQDEIKKAKSNFPFLKFKYPSSNLLV